MLTIHEFAQYKYLLDRYHKAPTQEEVKTALIYVRLYETKLCKKYSKEVVHSLIMYCNK